MSTVDTQVSVRVVDPDQLSPPSGGGSPAPTPLTGCEVALVPRDASNEDPADWPHAGVAANCPHSSDGVYLPAGPPAAGDWLLVVRAGGRNPVVQRLRFSGASDALKAKAGWSGHGPTSHNRRALIVSIDAHTVSRKTASITITVKSAEAREIVYLSGTEYGSAGTNFHLFALGRRYLRYKAKEIDSSTLCTIVMCDSDERITTIRATSSSWLIVGRQTFAAGTTGILQFYEAVHLAGQRNPGSVREMSIFSHAYPGGPILRNTYDESGSSTDRDPDDADGRMKDWKTGPGTVMTAYPKLKAALHADGFFKNWGCSATTAHKALIGAAWDKSQAKVADDRFFEVRWAYDDHGKIENRIRRNATQIHVRSMVAGIFATDHYATAARQFLGRKVLAAPPGMGSNYATQSGQPVNYVNQSISAHKKIYSYLQNEFGGDDAKPDAEGFLDYHAIGTYVDAHPALKTTAAWSTQRWEIDTPVNDPRPWVTLKLPTGSYVVIPRGRSFRIREEKDFFGGGLNGHLYEVRKAALRGGRQASRGRFVLVMKKAADPAKVAVFVQEDGKVFLLKPDDTAASGWALDTADLDEVELEGLDSKTVIDKGTTWAHGGTLETASPTLHW